MYVFFGVMLPVFLCLCYFWWVQVIDVSRRTFPDPNTKFVWIAVLLLTSILGAIVYRIVGKKQGTLSPP